MSHNSTVITREWNVVTTCALKINTLMESNIRCLEILHTITPKEMEAMEPLPQFSQKIYAEREGERESCRQFPSDSRAQ